MISIKRITDFDNDQIYALYKTLKWTSYTADKAKFKRMLKHSLDCLGAFNDKTLVGFIRVIGDTEHILYIQDILVSPTYQKQGIGTQLMESIIDKYKHVRQKVLMTDLNTNTDFYEKNGFKKANEISIQAYIKFD